MNSRAGPGHPAQTWAAVRRLFEQVLELPHEDRAAALARAEAPPGVAAEAAALLRQHEAEEAQGSAFLAAPALLLPPAARAGLRLGPWRLETPLGEGGMGQVWAARRADGSFEAQVAVKLLRTGPASPAWVAQFLEERRQLARLVHPHIARLLDAGRAPDGTPYLVMELVQGRPIDQACSGLGLAQRLGLFLQLCEAVAHAHRQLLVHRDLKPANVLVTADAQVKLLDFGIASPAEDAPAAEATTAAGPAPTTTPLTPLTPLSASPEQLRGEAVGTSTDVYALGVLLHLLLTGTRPYGRDARSSAQALQAALHEAPVAPSAAPLPADPARGLPRALLRGDLDAIVARACARRAEQRYPSVDALAADLRAHLAHLPVSARVPSWRYLAGRFLRRHRAAAAVGTTSLAALLALLAGLAWQVQKTEAARRDAEARVAEVRQLANRLVFSYHDRIVNLAGALPAREALLADAVGYLDGLARDAPQDPLLARELAATYHRVATLYGETFSPNLGKLAAATAAADKALAMLPLYIDGTAVDVAALNEAADLWQTRAQLHSRQGELQATVASLDQAQTLVQRALGLAPQDMEVRSRQATLAGRQALVLGGSAAAPNLGQLAEAGLRWRQALQVFEGLQREQPDNPVWTHQLAWALFGQVAWAVLDGRSDQAVALAERGKDLRDRAAASRPDDVHFRYQTAIARLNLATALAAAGRHDDALAAQAEAEARISAVARADAANSAAVRDLRLARLARARLLVGAGRSAQAQPLLRRVLADWPRAGQASDFYMLRWRAEAQVWLARALLPASPSAALQQAQEAAALLAGSDDNAARRWMLAQALGEQARAWQALGEPARAAASAGQAVAAWGHSVPGSQAARAEMQRRLAAGG